MSVAWRYAYDGFGDAVSLETALDFSGDEGKTVQSGKDDADINTIVRRFGVTGQLPQPNLTPFYGDFSDTPDYQSALNQMRDAEDAFMSLPADLRMKFQNDPAQLWDYLHNPDLDVAEARKLGLLRPEDAPPEPQLVRVVPDPTPPAGTPPAGGGNPST